MPMANISRNVNAHWPIPRAITDSLEIGSEEFDQLCVNGFSLAAESLPSVVSLVSQGRRVILRLLSQGLSYALSVNLAGKLYGPHGDGTHNTGISFG